jgi:hypothetical protein
LIVGEKWRGLEIVAEGWGHDNCMEVMEMRGEIWGVNHNTRNFRE